MGGVADSEWDRCGGGQASVVRVFEVTQGHSLGYGADSPPSLIFHAGAHSLSTYTHTDSSYCARRPTAVHPAHQNHLHIAIVLGSNPFY